MKCLDTNTIIAILNDRSAGARTWLARELSDGEQIGIPSIAVFEMVYGYEKSARRDRNEAALQAFLRLDVEVLPFTRIDAEHAGAIRAGLERDGTTIGHYDLLIAAQARSRDALLITANVREFARVPGLQVTRWDA